MIRAPLANTRAAASNGLGGVQEAPATAPITSALVATIPKMKALSAGPTSSTPRACWSPSEKADR